MWRKYQLPKSEGTRIHRVGKTILFVAIETAGEGDVLAASISYPDIAVPAARRKEKTTIAVPPLDGPGWSRYYMGASDSYDIVPGYPELPICISLREPFYLPPAADLRGWIFSHVEARIVVAGSAVASYPLTRPFKTLYGIPEAGVVCRHDEADFLASDEPVIDALHEDPGLVAHPVRLRNTSSGPVLVNELCVYGEQLSIFGNESRMQSERLLFMFSSSGVRMSLEGQTDLPAGWTQLAKPKVSGEERFIVRSIELFRAITRM